MSGAMELRQRQGAAEEWFRTVVCSILVLKSGSLQSSHSRPRMGVGVPPPASSCLWWLLAELGTRASGRWLQTFKGSGFSNQHFLFVDLYNLQPDLHRDCSAPGLAPFPRWPGAASSTLTVSKEASPSISHMPSFLFPQLFLT